MGVSIDTPTLWLGIYNLTSSERDMDFFLTTKEENGRPLEQWQLEHYSNLHVDRLH
jgi:hypothetical protein